MLTAIHRVHLKNGPWTTNGGYEYNAVLIGAALALAETGPGRPSLDESLGIGLKGPKAAAAALAAGIIGAAGAHAYASSQRDSAPGSPAAAGDSAASDGGQPAGTATAATS
jgi:putative oxidoreductase